MDCLYADSSSEATFQSQARQSLPTAEILSAFDQAGPGIDAPDDTPHLRHVSPARLAMKAQRGKGGTVRAVRGNDLRQTRVLMQALCEIRLELCEAGEALSPATLESRHTATMSLWQNRERALYTQPEVECGIEARLDAGFRHARNGSTREAAGEFKRAYLLLCCVLTLARDKARRKSGA